MSLGKASILAVATTFITHAAAHGYVSGVVAGGVYYQGYNPSFQYYADPPAVVGWSDPENSGNGFVNDYTSPDINCHLGATPGQAYATVAAGGTVDLQWTVWPESHHGPMIDYLANCNGECTTVDKTSLLWNKIDGVGLVEASPAPGTWGSDQMIANNNTWSVTIPTSIAPGKYVLRHETIALHSAGQAGGAQNYPQCINLEITGTGSDSLSGGTAGTELYTSSDPGILVNIYQVLSEYIVPGPAVISDAGGSVSDTPAISSSSAVPTTLQTTTRASSVAVSSSITTNIAAVSSTTTAAVEAPVTPSATSSFTAAEPSGSGTGKKFVCYEVTA